MPNHRLARQFLRRVWDAQLALMPEDREQEELTAFLAQKGADASWTDMPLEVGDDRVKLRLPDDTANLYYAINLFTESRRVKRFVSGGCWLYADLDEVDPRSLPDEIKPTIAVRSSPGRYQALWLLDRWLHARALARLNQKMTYYTKADRGNWKMTQVLRVPGTVSTKRDDPFEVELMWSRTKRLVYNPRELLALVGDVETPADLAHARELKLPKAPPRRILQRYNKKLTSRAKKLVATKTVLDGEDRSSRLWELECLLLEAGMKPEEVYVVVRATVWNKWAGNSREETQLWAEVQKAAANVARKKKNGKSKTPTSVNIIDDDEEEEAASVDEFPPVNDFSDNGQPEPFTPMAVTRYLGKGSRDPAWLVESIWAQGAHGLWAGDYKTYKSTMLNDLAISVASGKPFLGHYEVHNPGAVLVVQEENGPAFMHDKLHRIMMAKGLGTELLSLGGGRLAAHLGHALPAEFLNMKRFDLTNDDHLRWLDLYVATNNIKLVILDPLYRLAPTLDENQAVDMAPMLAWLATLADERETAVILAHHYNKPKQDSAIRIGHKVSGSGVLNRWWASSVYVERMGQEEDHSVRFTAQHREHPASAHTIAHFEMPEGDPDAYTVELSDGHDEETVQIGGEEMERSHQRRPKKKESVNGNDALDSKLDHYLQQISRPFWVMELANKLKVQSRVLYPELERRGYTFTREKRVNKSDGEVKVRIKATPPEE